MSKKILFYLLFFACLLLGFYFLVFRDYDFSKSNLKVINYVQNFSFVNQNGKKISLKDLEGKVYLVEYFFTTCKGICPKMNANMRRVFDVYKNEPDFVILSHTCMPETDSISVLKDYEYKILNSKVIKSNDGSYKLEPLNIQKPTNNSNWNFVTGDKNELYKMARESYIVDNNKPDSSQLIKDQFIHTQFFRLVDKQGRSRGEVYDGLKEEEIQKLILDIKDLLKEKVSTQHFMNGFNNNPN